MECFDTIYVSIVEDEVGFNATPKFTGFQAKKVLCLVGPIGTGYSLESYSFDLFCWCQKTGFYLLTRHQDWSDLLFYLLISRVLPTLVKKISS